MKLPQESSSSWAHVEFASFAWASLRAWASFEESSPDDQAYFTVEATALRKVTDDLVREARETQDQTMFQRPAAQAMQNARLAFLKRITGEAITIVSLRLGQNSKDAKPVREFMPDLTNTLSRKPIAERPAEALRAADRLEHLSGEFAEKASLVSRFRAAATSAERAVTQNEDAFDAWDKERSEEVVAKGRLRIELERVHRSLGARFPGQREFVESFFLRGSKPSESPEPEPDPKPSPPNG